jgi:hypothetical protein
MRSVTVIVTVFLSIFSTMVMSYISLATPIGPWIAPTLVIIALPLFRLLVTTVTASTCYAVAAGSIGGIMATACAFSLPTLYFLDSHLFNSWMQSPIWFSLTVGGFSLLAALFGMLIADVMEKTVIDVQQLSFPIAHLVHKIITAHNSLLQTYQLAAGCAVAALLQCGGALVSLCLSHASMLCAIGFVTGYVIAVPLAIGACATVLVVRPLHQFFFHYMTSMECMLAFSSGVVLCITIIGMITLLRQFTQLHHGVKKMMQGIFVLDDVILLRNMLLIIVIAVGLCITSVIFAFPWYVLLYLVVCSIITTYQIAAISGRIGLALLGRFATFVMVPAMLIFPVNYTHIVLIATFVEISGGVAADILCGRKLAQLASLSHCTMRKYQLLGLIVASLTVGIVLWLLINHFGLGVAPLCAYRAQSRQLLICVQQCNYGVVALGALFGLLLHACGCNSMLVLGGLLLPIDITCCLVAGGLLAYVSTDEKRWYPLWSGVFVGSSLLMIVHALCY